MGQRGRLAELSKEDIRYTDRVVKLYYDENKKQQQIKTELGLSSVSVVAELLRRDMMKRVQEFKSTPTNSPEYQEKLASIIKFLRKQRKMDFIEMATVLNLPRAEIAKYLQKDSNLRNFLSASERNDRAMEMKRLSMEEGLSITDIGRTFGVSKQLVSRIFKSMGYVPVKGTRNYKIKAQQNAPAIVKMVADDADQKVREIHAKMDRQRLDFANYKAYTNATIIGLRCTLINEICANLNHTNLSEFKIQKTHIRKVYNAVEKTTSSKTRPAYYQQLVDALQVIERTERSVHYKQLREAQVVTA